MMKEGRKKLVFEACYSVARNENIPVKHRMVVLQACEALYEKEGEKYCDFDLIHKYPDRFITMSIDIAELHKLRPDLIDWLIDNDVEVSASDALPEGIGGIASCYRDKHRIEYKFQPTRQDTIRILSHEIAHCKEHVVRAKKGLPPSKGEWREGRIPVGSEERAVHFEKRMLSRL